MTEPRIGNCSRGHTDERRDHVVPERNARESQRVVRRMKRKERPQPPEGTEAPAPRIDAINQSLEKPASLACDPFSRNVARNQECKGSAERGTCEIPKAAPERTEQGSAGKAEDDTRNESDGAQRKQHHVADRCPRAKRSEPCIEGRQIDLVAVNDRPPRHCCEH